MCTSCCHRCIRLGKGKPTPTLLASYFTLKLLIEYEESLFALTNNVSGYCQLTAKDIPFAVVQDTDFWSATKLKQKAVEKFDVNAPCVDPGDSQATEKQKRDIQAPTEAELNSFYEKLNTC